MIIYKAKNLINNKLYVGKTSSLFNRKRGHFNDAKKGSVLVFHKAIRKYGESNFKFFALHICDSTEDVNEKEKYFIQKYNTMTPYGYNMTGGGDGGAPCKEVREKIRKTLTGRERSEEFKEKHRVPCTEERKEKLRIPWTEERKEKAKGRKNPKLAEYNRNRRGQLYSEEHCKRISESLIGHIVTQEIKQKISEAKRGKKTGPRSEEAKQNMRKSRGPMSEEHKQKLRGPRKPWSRTEEEKRKMSKSHRRKNND